MGLLDVFECIGSFGMPCDVKPHGLKCVRVCVCSRGYLQSMRGLPDYFERIYPLCIILAAILIAANVHQRIAKALGNAWRRFRFETDDEPWDEATPLGSSTNLLAVSTPGSPVHCSPAGLAILKKGVQGPCLPRCEMKLFLTQTL